MKKNILFIYVAILLTIVIALNIMTYINIERFSATWPVVVVNGMVAYIVFVIAKYHIA
jgi:hypothetical protein